MMFSPMKRNGSSILTKWWDDDGDGGGVMAPPDRENRACCSCQVLIWGRGFMHSSVLCADGWMEHALEMREMELSAGMEMESKSICALFWKIRAMLSRRMSRMEVLCPVNLQDTTDAQNGNERLWVA